jgi:hypothetical protein
MANATNLTTAALTTLATMAAENNATHVAIDTFWGTHYLLATDADGTRHTLLGRCRLDGTQATDAGTFDLDDDREAGRFVPTYADLGLRV